MTIDLHGRSFLKEIDFTKEEFTYLIDLAEQLRDDKRSGNEVQRLAGRNIALIFEKSSTRTRSAFEAGAHDQGSSCHLHWPRRVPARTQRIDEGHRVLGRMFDGIEYRGFAQERVEVLAEYAGVPVWNGLTGEWHPTQMLADVLTMRAHAGRPLEEIAYCYLGDARNNTANSLLVTGALLGADVRLAAPEALLPSPAVRQIAERLAAISGARITLTADHDEAVAGADFLYTDVWLSMGEPEDKWSDRIRQLLPYQVNAALLKATGNPSAKFLHCLPALHNRETEVGEMIFEKWGLDALEVTDEVFESDASVVFEQAENRLHTIKAVMVATLGS